jgi:outer membrane protein assembly factor BamA
VVRLLLIWLLISTATVQAATISAVEFRGNRKSRAAMLDLELEFAAGDPLDLAQIERGRQALLDLGLFREVRVEVTRDRRVIYHLKERHYQLLLPRLRGEGSGGYEAGLDL